MLASVISSSGCATMEPKVKINGIDVKKETTQSVPEAIVAIGLIGAAIALGVVLANDKDSNSNTVENDNYINCINSGLPAAYCQSLGI